MQDDIYNKRVFRAAWDGWDLYENPEKVVREELERYGFQVKNHSDPETDENFEYSEQD